MGFQSHNDTYTKKLAYIIYYDEKGTLRKEASWNSWRDKSVDNKEYENEPTIGFVLNKKAGGYSTGWNHRQTYVRVYDPRGMEFEITVPNLIYILENTNSIKGKGLEGEFVYGWDGTELVLIPTESPDYKEISQYNKKMHNRIKLKGKDMKLGGTYLTKDNQELIYLGRFDEWKTDYDAERQEDELGNSYYPKITKGKTYFFKGKDSYGNGITTIKTLSSKLIGVVSEECVENYADLMDILQRNSTYSPVDGTKDEYVDYTLEEFKEKVENNKFWCRFYSHDYAHISLHTKDGVFYYEKKNPDYKPRTWTNTSSEPYYIKVKFGNIEEVYNELKPIYQRKYLANGKLYSEDK